jgi:predicted nucleotidyltransferase
MISSNQIINPIKTILQKHKEVLFAYLFGSYANGDNGPLSDVDIAVYLKNNLLSEEQENIAGALRSDLEKELQMPDKVGLVLLNEELPPALEHDIVYNGKLIYVQNETARSYYEAETICRWLDYKPHHERMMQEILYAV